MPKSSSECTTSTELERKGYLKASPLVENLRLRKILINELTLKSKILVGFYLIHHIVQGLCVRKPKIVKTKSKAEPGKKSFIHIMILYFEGY